MSNLKVLLHRICKHTCSKPQEQMITRLSGCVKVKGGGVWTKAFIRYLNDKVNAFRTVGMQCNVIAAHRIRRTAQILNLYRSLYGEKTPVQFFKRLGELLHRNPEGKLIFMLGAAFFDWKENKVSDKDLLKVEEELQAFFDAKSADANIHDGQGETWERLLNEEHFKLWRCPVKGSSLYKYKVFGSYKDVTPRAFFSIQLDLEYRKQWDNHVIRLEKIEEDSETGSEVIYWATHFPMGFLYDRDYVYVRRSKIDRRKNLMTLTAKSVDHPSFPVKKEYIRVGDYTSQMVIRPHTTFDENGFDYVMSYFDNPQLYVPSWTINKLTVSSLPAFLEQLHQAAKDLVKNRQITGLKHDDRSNNSVHSQLINVGKKYGYINEEEKS